jgi:DNA-binding NtrC family response regulator
MISGYASVENIVRAMKFGALNFYKKPINIKDLIAEIRKISGARQPESAGKAVHQIITQEPKIRRLFSIMEKVASTDVPVVVTGESGTGKELFAQALHEMSPRKDGPLIKINCAAIPETLLESELFGYEKGAFTDAKNTRIGRFEEAAGGSVFLDEIGEMNIKTQAKLLRVLQEKEFQRLGSNTVHRTDARFIAASNRDFAELIAHNLFREDLYYRLSVVRLEVPPLRERKGDIPLLANYFLDHFNLLYGKNIVGFSEGVTALFLKHSWPGNVRELRNCIERAVIFTDEGKVSEESLPFQYETIGSSDPEMYQNIIDNVSREMILDALDKCGVVRKEAAELLNIHRKTSTTR